MVVLVTCNNEEDLIKNEGARVFTTAYIDFSDAQGQITPESLVESGRISNSYKVSCMSSYQHFLHYNSIGGICCHGNQSSYPI